MLGGRHARPSPIFGSPQSQNNQWLKAFHQPQAAPFEAASGRVPGSKVKTRTHDDRRICMRKMMIAAAALAVTAAPALAQVSNSQGLIAVNVQDLSLLNNFLNSTQISALNNLSVPVTVQAPISVAANVCHLSVAALASQKNKGGGSCTATSGSAALARLVSQQMLSQKMKKH